MGLENLLDVAKPRVHDFFLAHPKYSKVIVGDVLALLNFVLGYSDVQVELVDEQPNRIRR